MPAPTASRARLGLDRRTTEIVVVPLVRMITINGVRGVWVPLHPLAETRKG